MSRLKIPIRGSLCVSAHPLSAFLRSPCASLNLESKKCRRSLPLISIGQKISLKICCQVVMYIIAAALSVLITTTILVPTNVFVTTSTEVTTYIPTETTQLVPITIITTLPITKHTSISTVVNVPVTVTIPTTTTMSTTSSVLSVNYNPISVLLPLYILSTTLGVAFGGISLVGNLKYPHPNTADAYKICSIVVMTISFVFTVTSAVFQDERITVKGNIWGNHANVGIDIVKWFGSVGCIIAGAIKHKFKPVEKENIRVWIILVVTFVVAVVGLLSSSGSCYTDKGNSLHGFSFWWVGFIA